MILDIVSVILMMWVLFKIAGWIFKALGRIAGFLLGSLGYLLLGIIAVTVIGLAIYALPVILIIGILGLAVESSD